MKNILSFVLKLRFFPKLSYFLFNNETWLRIRPLKSFFEVVDPENVKRIIDIGGGSGRLELELGRTDVHIYDTNEESINIAKKDFKNATVGNGKTIEFDDDSFDWAISIHTLEHISKNDREQFIMEMIRISKEGVFLNFPEGLFAEELCTNFLDSLKKNGKEPNKWTREHLSLGLPMVNEIASIVEKQDKFFFKYSFIRNYDAENYYWSKIRATNIVLISYFLSPIISICKFLKYRKRPTVELIMLGYKSEENLRELFRRLGMIRRA